MSKINNLITQYANTRNPILPLTYHIPDAEAHVMPDGKLYIYGSYDESTDVFCSNKYVVVSTEDMKQWDISDVSFRGENVPWFFDKEAKKYQGVDWSNPTPFIKKMLENPLNEAEKEKFEVHSEGEKKPLLFAPDCISKNGKYYLYFCMQDDSEGVAIADNPDGPFDNPVQLPCGGIDPAIFVDTDGQAYYYWGQLFAHGVKLNDDMISFNEKDIIKNIVTEEEHYFHEGSSMRKIKDTYYFVYSSIVNGKPTSLSYATAKSPLGPFVYRGVIINNEWCDPASWNNHGSIEKVGDQWYVFYHRCSRGVQQYRRLCIEPITIHEDGSIDEVKMTSQGVGAPFTNDEKIYAYQACELHGSVYIGKCKDGGEQLMYIKEQDSAVFRYITSTKRIQHASIEAAGKGCIEVYLDDNVVGSIEINGNGVFRTALKETIGENMELILRFSQVNNLNIYAITLE